MFSKILIANRGEIACRIMRTAHRLGIKTVAVYSEADRTALHVDITDEAVLVGPPPSAESYLVADRIVAAAKETGAEAVHPGYGFLSENADFATALDAAGIAFVGPNVRAIGAMGDKIESKKIAAEAKVNTVPGHIGVIKDDAEAIEIAREIGYPVMIKASAGGGGKGMRVARSDDEARDGFRSATNEAKSSFADDRVFIEKFIEQPRHIEIQILADGHGNIVHLNERECSIQRRHQKVIEEAPSPFIDAETRAAMGEQAVRLARAVDYRSAGTVEFIVDKDRNFYFLEMNTRLQVEHPVTEYITGLDLVELMLRVAAGDKLPFTQEQVGLDGWAMECRVYAEDPLRGFLPSIGRLTRYREPPSADWLRVDSGVEDGGEISMFYDPMIAKVISHGRDRDQAIARMADALDAYVVRGVQHNMAFLRAVMERSRFVEGNLTTDFIDEEFPGGFHGAEPDPSRIERLVAVAATIGRAEAARATLISGQVEGHEPGVGDDWVVRLGTENIAVRTVVEDDGTSVVIGDRTYVVGGEWQAGDPLFMGSLDGHPVRVQVERTGLSYRLIGGGASIDALVLSPRAGELMAHMPIKEAADTSRFLLSPMPGLLVSLAVEPGQDVKTGQEMAVVEAMKMENILRAERDGTIKTLHAQPGDSLAVDQEIVEFE